MIRWGKAAASIAGVATAVTGTANADAAIGFQLGSTVEVGAISRAVAVDDLDDDGRQDLVAATGTTVAVRLGAGDGSFGPLSAFPAPSAANPRDVALAHLDGDGHLDVVTSNSNLDSVSVGLGTGTGALGVNTQFAVGDAPARLAIGRLDGNSTPDLVVANEAAGTVSVLLGTGAGGFGAASSFAAGNLPFSVALGDVDADGDLDVAVANKLTSASTASVLRNDGAGTLGGRTAHAVADLPHDVALEDLDSDGALDLVTANFTGGNVSVLRGTGAGTFGSLASYPTGTTPYAVVAADLDDDGALDLATPNRAPAGTVSVLRGAGDGSFGSLAGFPVGQNPEDVATSDLDDDGNLDLLVMSSTGASVSALVNAAPTGIALSPAAVAFDATLPGATGGERTVTLTNDRGRPLAVDAVAVAGRDASQFSLESETCTAAALSPAASCTATVGFSPASPGAKAAHLSVSDDAGSGIQTVALTGTGVDVDPPDTAIDTGPPGVTSQRAVTFTFSSEPGATFECRLDSADLEGYEPCGSPLTTPELPDGGHTFEVRAADASGNVDPSPATATFVVDATPPETSIAAGPDGRTNDTTPTFELTSSEPGSFVCRVDGGPASDCASPHTTSALTLGAHTFSAQAVDTAGNADPTAATRAFDVTAATQLAAKPVTLQLGLLTLRLTPRATLTTAADRAPLPGRTVVFSAGGRQVCGAVTDGAGVASCTGAAPVLATLLSLGYEARFAATATHDASAAAGPLIASG